MIPVTKPFTPPIEDYKKLLDGIWDRNWLTNNGPLVNQLESGLREYLDVPHLLYLSNGTIALQIAIKALGITKKIITTPFSYVATTSSIVWEGCTPVYVDIDPLTLNIDPSKIETAIDEDTEAILATHCFGNPCDIDAIDKIAQKYKLKVIYDAAHCFGTSYKGKSIFSYGDVSTVSFHATKLYHTIEGGAVFSSSREIIKKMEYLRNFGHNGPEKYHGIGINGKNSEFHAAMGIINLRFIDEIRQSRKSQFEYYISNLIWSNLTRPITSEDSVSNNSYFPILFKSNVELNSVLDLLNRNNIFPRRYFYPSLNTLSYVTGRCPISESISSRILCLPMFVELKESEQKEIVELLNIGLKLQG